MKMSRPSSQLTAYKYSGTGNSFLFFDARQKGFNNLLKEYFGKMSRAGITQLLCNTSFGVGADGVVFVENPEPKDFKKLSASKAAANVHLKWDFYNSDGSTSEMCGNGARCMGAFGQDLGFKKSPLRFISRAGLIEVTNPELDKYTVVMPELSAFAQNIKAGKGVTFDFVDSGVPHAVVTLSKKYSFAPAPGSEDFAKLEKIVKQIRSLKRFEQSGTNVTFVWPGRDDLHIYALTFERGVTGYTQACGTGAVAAAYATHFLNLDHIVDVSMPGGPLQVTLSGARPTLNGRVDFIASVNF